MTPEQRTIASRMEVDTSALEDDPILKIARREYARSGGVDWDKASLEDRRYFIAAAAKRWMDDLVTSLREQRDDDEQVGDA